MGVALECEDEAFGAGPVGEEGAVEGGGDLFGLEGVVEDDGKVVRVGEPQRCASDRRAVGRVVWGAALPEVVWAWSEDAHVGAQGVAEALGQFPGVVLGLQQGNVAGAAQHLHGSGGTRVLHG
ncbi:hypothetical protein [Streptomyces sp. RK75]|uniref:hypothetical protein n=1 Tax=Streptomyces sp. RK75 TaxID=2824895 RepID=UPI001B3773C1|nr:hypothetical protein [Streptomyces sp. RK75]MBQ0867413.1 hypothetical protein [Streptomyces sp. RK75]